MIRTVASVIRGEGLPSALRRAGERMSESARAASLRVSGLLAGSVAIPLLNVVASGAAPRLGGVQQQLAARLAVERKLRAVALLTPGRLELSRPHGHVRRVSRDLESGVREAIALTGARAVHFEGTYEVPPASIARLRDSGIDILITAHDFALFCARPNLYEEPGKGFCHYSEDPARCARCLRQTWNVPDDEQTVRRALARELLSSAKATIFPSNFLLEQHRRLFALPALEGELIAPAVETRGAMPSRVQEPKGVAFVGNVIPPKGGLLVPELARLGGSSRFHVFGGGDEELFRAMRRMPQIEIHGYYRAGELPALLVRHEIGLVIVPSVWPETFGLVISEAWRAGAAVAAFDLGAQAERIREQGGGWLAPLESGAAGLGAIVERWRAGELQTAIPSELPRPHDAARAHVELYHRHGFLPDR
ncbi:MAG: glycosyltransferase [Thermoanaerobaculia bacterium]|jgi:glycosyltransferase involved in cell wall biosynthesis